MKNLFSMCAFVCAVAVLSLTSCKKDYTCTCTDADGTVTTTTPYVDYKEADAEDACALSDTTANVTCVIAETE